MLKSRERESRSPLIPSLPAHAWLVAASAGVVWIGGGLISPYLLIYLVNVQRLSLISASEVLSLVGIAAIVGTPAVGIMIDRLGAKGTLAASLILIGAGAIGLSFAHTSVETSLAVFVYGLGQRVSLPAGSTLLFLHTPVNLRSQAFSVRYAIVNAGIGLGGLTGGFIVNVHHPLTFQTTFVAQVALCIVSIGLIAAVPWQHEQLHPQAPTESNRSSRLTALFRDHNFRYIWLLTLLLYTVGISQLKTGFALYVTNVLGASPILLGTAYAMETFTIVFMQFPVLRLVVGRRRMMVVTVLFTVLVGAWLLTTLAALLPPLGMAISICTAAVLFGLTETLMSPTLPPAVAELAPPDAQGRYNSLFSLSQFLGTTFAPVLAGVLLNRNHAGVFTLSLASMAALGALGAKWSNARLSPTIARIPASSEPVGGKQV